MTKIVALLLTLLIPTVSFAKPPKLGPPPPLNYTPPEPERRVLSNGIIVYLLEDHELPLFGLSLFMKVTPEDRKKVAPKTAGFLSGQWRDGGTLSRKPDELDKELEYLPARVSTGFGEETASISLSCLSKDMDIGLEIFADVLFNPRFDSKRFSLAKDKALEGLRRKNDNPSNIARRAFRDILYGETHYYAQNATEKDIKRVKKKDLKTLHKNTVVPDHAYISISGDFDTEKILATLEKLFENWKPTGRVLEPYDYSLRSPPKGRLFFVDKDVSQARIYVGRVGVSRHSPDEFNFKLANYILGGSGPSRLFAQIRSRLGLAYSVGSFYSENKGPGIIGMGLQTKNETVVEAIQAIIKELELFSSEKVRPEELKLAKDSEVNSFIFRFESTGAIVSRALNIEYYGYPKDYLKTFTKKIKAVSRDDILNMTGRLYKPEDMVILVVGKRAEFGDEFKNLGPAVEIPLESIK